jgi:predicted nucleotide-binding protein (sugar kinase/HSP70/actin superfamily)
MVQDLGLSCIVPPATTRRTLDVGSAHSPELACIPFKLMLGNYVEALERGATHLLGLSSRFGASCRLYFFPAVHEIILRDMGYDFELVAMDSGRRDSGGEIARTTRERIGKSVWDFARLFLATFMRKLLAAEKVERLAAETRPYEARRGETSRVMARALRAVDRAEPRRLRALMREVADEFRSIERRPDARPLKIGLVGELFVLSDPFSNLGIEERLGDMGVLAKRTFWVSKKILRTVWRWLDPDYARAMRAASRYFGVDIGAECNVTVGDAVESRRHGFDGLVHLMPFTCMPEIVAESVLPRAKADSGTPVITFALDEQTSSAGMQTRLEAFVDLLARQRDQASGSRRGAARLRAALGRAATKGHG